ncbi:unnamed protein product [Leptosia nina]|uniref:Uncharacterized protein n=1 Tax=Leptosia nina TaxID=320188 RepID=A0AAV1JZN2_9NEOP
MSNATRVKNEIVDISFSYSPYWNKQLGVDADSIRVVVVLAGRSASRSCIAARSRTRSRMTLALNLAMGRRGPGCAASSARSLLMHYPPLPSFRLAEITSALHFDQPYAPYIIS